MIAERGGPAAGRVKEVHLAVGKPAADINGPLRLLTSVSQTAEAGEGSPNLNGKFTHTFLLFFLFFARRLKAGLLRQGRAAALSGACLSWQPHLVGFERVTPAQVCWRQVCPGEHCADQPASAYLVFTYSRGRRDFCLVSGAFFLPALPLSIHLASSLLRPSSCR